MFSFLYPLPKERSSLNARLHAMLVCFWSKSNLNRYSRVRLSYLREVNIPLVVKIKILVSDLVEVKFKALASLRHRDEKQRKEKKIFSFFWLNLIYISFFITGINLTTYFQKLCQVLLKNGLSARALNEFSYSFLSVYKSILSIFQRLIILFSTLPKFLFFFFICFFVQHSLSYVYLSPFVVC